MGTIYEILLNFWYTIGAPDLNYYINTFLYILSFIFMLAILLSPILLLFLIFKIFGGIFGGYNE